MRVPGASPETPSLETALADVHMPEGLVYLDGNSLGPLSASVVERAGTVVETQWGNSLIAGWNTHDWLGLPTRVGERLAPLMGAGPGQVLCCDNLTSNLFKLVTAALSMQPGRRVVVSERHNFPTDVYVLQGLVDLIGPERLEIRLLDADDLYEADYSDVALTLVTHVNFRTGAMHDLARLTDRVQQAGSLMLWDLAHSLGVTDLELDRHNVDMAVGCTYKFLNGGPGAPGFLYLAQRHHGRAENPIAGWMGHRNLFAFEADYSPAPGIERFLTGTQGVLGLSVVDAALDLVAPFSPEALRARSVALTEYFLVQKSNYDRVSALNCLTPADSLRRGSQVCLTHPEGYAIVQALIDAGVVVDFRDPDVIRFGFSPLYNTAEHADRALSTLELILSDGRYRDARFNVRHAVT